MSADTSAPTVSYSSVEGVAHIKLNRPESSNAVDMQTAIALGEAVDLAAESSSVRAVLLTGAGSRFCAGGDVAAMVAAEDRGQYVEALANALDQSLQRLASLEKPVVAGVRGAVAGAGLSVMLSCDLVVAATGTRFVTAYSGVGLTPDCGLSWLLPRAVGQQRALELLLTNKVIDSEQAHAWGMVNEVVPPDALLDSASSLAAGLAAGPSWSNGQSRRLVRQSWESSRAATGADEAITIGRAVMTAEANELLAAFSK